MVIVFICAIDTIECEVPPNGWGVKCIYPSPIPVLSPSTFSIIILDPQFSLP